MYQLIIGVMRENSPPVRLQPFKSSLWDNWSPDDQTLLQSWILQAVSELDRHIAPPTGQASSRCEALRAARLHGPTKALFEDVGPRASREDDEPINFARPLPANTYHGETFVHSARACRGG